MPVCFIFTLRLLKSHNMRLFRAFVLLFFINLSFSPLRAQTYEGKLVIFFKDTLEGKITVNLTGENKGLVYIESSTQTTTKKKGTKTTASVTENNGYNPAIISALLINGKTYKFKDLRFDYEEKNNLENCCVEQIFGNDSIGIYQWTDKNQQISWFSFSPRFNERAESLSHPKYNDGGFRTFTGMRFARCKTLGDKMYDMAPGYFYENKTASPEEKLEVWKNIIRDYIACW